MTITSKTKNIISSLLIFSVLLPSAVLSIPPKKAEASGLPVVDIVHNLTSIWNGITQTGTLGSTIVNTGLHIKDFAVWLIKKALMLIAKAALARITQATINWINSDFHGSPLFLENPGSFFKDIAKSQVQNMVDMIGYDTFKFPYGKQTALNIISSYRSQLETNAQYTLSKVINDPDLLVKYRNDFNFSGWNGFLVNTQYPQNNAIGFETTIMSELARKVEGAVQAPAQKVQSLLQQGMGFLSPQTCPSNPSYNNGLNEFNKPSFKPKSSYPGIEVYSTGASDAEIAAYNSRYYAAVAADKAEWAKKNDCPGGLVNTTPGSVAANQIMGALGSNMRTTELGIAMGNSLSAILDALVNKMLDKGLNAISGAISGGSSSSEDNWTYNGDTLSGGTTGVVGTFTTLSIPQNVSVDVGGSTSTLISGGVKNYNVQTQSAASKAVAIASVDTSGSSGAKLKITGVGVGTTSVIVSDSSTPSQKVTINVTVTGVGALKSIPASVSANKSKPVTVTISGGVQPYTMVTGPNENVAVADFSDTILVVTGMEAGSTYVEIRDAANNVKRVNITIIDPKALKLSRENVVAYKGRTDSTTTISGGNGNYAILAVTNEGIAAAGISGDKVSITGIAKGETSVLIRDTATSSSASQNITLNVSVIEPLVVSPASISVSRSGISQRTDTATISGGDGNYSIQTEPNTSVANATISGKTLTITAGNTRGSTLVVVKDSSTTHPQTFTVNITVN